MPLGTRHIITGMLRRRQIGESVQLDGGMLRLTRPGNVVELDDGDFWIVEVGLLTLLRHRNRRVVVEGVRCGFNELNVERVFRAA